MVFATTRRGLNVTWLPLAGLLVGVLLAWCSATSTWSAPDFGRPAAYVEDPSKSDIIAVYAGLKAGAAGEATPYFWKRVLRLNAPFEANWTDWPSLDALHGLVLVGAAKLVGVFAGHNLTLLLGHLLAAATFFAVATFFIFIIYVSISVIRTIICNGKK